MAELDVWNRRGRWRGLDTVHSRTPSLLCSKNTCNVSCVFFVYSYIYIHTNIFTYIHTFIHIYVHTYFHMFLSMYVCIQLACGPTPPPCHLDASMILLRLLLLLLLLVVVLMLLRLRQLGVNRHASNTSKQARLKYE